MRVMTSKRLEHLKRLHKSAKHEKHLKRLNSSLEEQATHPGGSIKSL